MASSENISMSKFEEEKIIATIQSLSPEQQIIAVRQLSDDVLWDELRRRYNEAVELGQKMKALIN